MEHRSVPDADTTRIVVLAVGPDPFVTTIKRLADTQESLAVHSRTSVAAALDALTVVAPDVIVWGDDGAVAFDPEWTDSDASLGASEDVGETAITGDTGHEHPTVNDDDRVELGSNAVSAPSDEIDSTFLRRVSEYDSTVPIVVCTVATARDAQITPAFTHQFEYNDRGGVTIEHVHLESDDSTPASDTIPIDGVRSLAGAELFNTIRRLALDGQRERARHRSARGFEAVFSDERSATWVLDAEGYIRRANDPARTYGDPEVPSGDDGRHWAVSNGGVDSAEDVSAEAYDSDINTGPPFWALSAWADPAGVQSDVRSITESALSGSVEKAVVEHDIDGETRVTELSVQPALDASGNVAIVVVDGVDSTERVALERELRRSEALHRVTLNNMTDTVLITNEAGEYTYVCPNVHFIFGYTAAEIHDLGTIDALLGEQLFDREELEAQGVLKNIECTATDKSGREHHLLVNVRSVSIQDGTLLYSCRDVTQRAQREEALATLQGTAREFLYADTATGIAERVTRDASSVVGADAAAVYLFSEADARLEPIASTATMDRLHGPLEPIGIDTETIPGSVFIDGERRFFADVREADILANPASGLASLACVPLGDHGVLLVGSESRNAFDDVTRELVDLLAATAEAALDRVAREAQLREQERELQWRNSQLSALNQINETIREVHRALVAAETRPAIDDAVCDLLTTDDRFTFAWIGTSDPTGEYVEVRASAGDGRGYLDDQQIPIATDDVEPAGRAVATREVTAVAQVGRGLRDAPWRADALAREFLSVLSVPLVYNDVSYGVLTVYSDESGAIDDASKDVFAELGETIAAAISAVERTNALVATSMTEITVAIDDPSFVLSRLAQAANCTVQYGGGVTRSAAATGVFVTISDADSDIADADLDRAAEDLYSTNVDLDTVAAIAETIAGVEGVQRIAADGSGGVLRLDLSQPFLATALADHGAVLRGATASPEETTIDVSVPETVDVRHVLDLLRGTFEMVELRSKRATERVPDRTVQSRFVDSLTPRQAEVLQTAYYAGFFESPRRNSGEDVADLLGISSTAFYGHIRAVQRTLFALLLEPDAE